MSEVSAARLSNIKTGFMVSSNLHSEPLCNSIERGLLEMPVFGDRIIIIGATMCRSLIDAVLGMFWNDQGYIMILIGTWRHVPRAATEALLRGFIIGELPNRACAKE